ncbi:hypothetical protein ACFQ07_01215, partial [Actinomadura adrarensis]
SVRRFGRRPDRDPPRTLAGMSLDLPGGVTAMLGFDAVAIGRRDPTEEVRVGVHLSGDLTALDPIQISELLSDLTSLTG